MLPGLVQQRTEGNVDNMPGPHVVKAARTHLRAERRTTCRRASATKFRYNLSCEPRYTAGTYLEADHRTERRDTSASDFAEDRRHFETIRRTHHSHKLWTNSSTCQIHRRWTTSPRWRSPSTCEQLVERTNAPGCGAAHRAPQHEQIRGSNGLQERNLEGEKFRRLPGGPDD